jgi:hypothetical protein
MSTDTTYNGWTNYPTWNVHLWITNEESLYDWALELVRGVVEVNRDTANAGQTVRYQASGRIKDWVVDELAPDLGASFAADLLGYALDQVNWVEIADSMIQAADELTV